MYQQRNILEKKQDYICHAYLFITTYNDLAQKSEHFLVHMQMLSHFAREIYPIYIHIYPHSMYVYKYIHILILNIYIFTLYIYTYIYKYILTLYVTGKMYTWKLATLYTYLQEQLANLEWRRFQCIMFARVYSPVKNARLEFETKMRG